LRQPILTGVKSRLSTLTGRARGYISGAMAPETPQARQARQAAHDPRRGRLLMSGLALLLLCLALLIIFFEWNWLRGPIGRIASAQLHREVVLSGDLDVSPWSLSPTVEARDLLVGQPDWIKDDRRMATVGRLVVSIQLVDLFRGRTVLRLIEVDRAQLHLVRNRDGRANWQIGGAKSTSAPRIPAIRSLIIDNADLTIDDARRGAAFEGRITTRDSTTGEGAGRFKMNGEGRLNGAAFSAEVSGSPLLNISPDRPYRFQARVSSGATRIAADGHIDRPFDLNVLGARFSISGNDLNDLYLLTGLTLPNTGPYKVSAGLVRDHRRVHLNNLSGEIGDSDISGQLSVETDHPKPLLIADLRSRRLDFDDLGSLFGMAPQTGKGETASAEQTAMAGRQRATGRLLSDATLQVDRIRSMDAEVRYRADAVNAPGLPLRKVSLTLSLKDGVMKGTPVAFSLARGDIRGGFTLDASGAVPRTDIDFRMTGGRLEDWVTTRVQGLPVISGGLVARLKLSGTGNSLHKTAASANGALTVVSPGGEVRQAFAELLGVNVSKGLILLLSEDPKKTALRCAVADFQVRDGVARANHIVADTGVVLIKGKGTVNFGTERMNLTLEGDSKKPRLLRVFAPVTISGPLTGPKVGVKTGELVGQGGVALALGAVLSPLAAILPFVDAGLAEDANCSALMREGRQQGAPPVKSKAG
jgi:AsmA family protein